MNNIKTDYPKSFEKLKEWAMKYLTTFQKKVAEQAGKGEEVVIMDIPPAFADMYAQNITVNYRQLFDFFDENGIHVFVKPLYKDVSERDHNGWLYGTGITEHIGTFKTRAEAEHRGLTNGFEILEEKL